MLGYIVITYDSNKTMQDTNKQEQFDFKHKPQSHTAKPKQIISDYNAAVFQRLAKNLGMHTKVKQPLNIKKQTIFSFFNLNVRVCACSRLDSKMRHTFERTLGLKERKKKRKEIKKHNTKKENKSEK